MPDKISQRQRPLVASALRGQSFAFVSERMSLVGVAEYWLGDLKDEDLARLSKRVRDALKQGKEAASDPVSGIRLYKDGDGLLTIGSLVERDHAELAFELWRAKFPPWEALSEEFGYGTPFASIAMSYRGSLGPLSLAHLVNFLSDLLIAECKYFRQQASEFRERAKPAQKSAAALPKARAERIRRQQERANAHEARARQMAREYWQAHPSAELPAVVAHLRRSENFPDWTADISFKRAIRGCQKEALRAIDASARSAR